MSLFTDASLVYVPSGVKDGKTYSITPTDGSGDLTFSRGSDIEATRVAANGYIQKAQVNLLLQSNTFNTTWTIVNSAVLTSGQADKDGGTDAWLIASNGTGNAHISQSVTAGVATLSVYAKAGTLNWMRLYVDISGANASAWFNLATGALGTSYNSIEHKIESIGSGWYRCILVVPNGGTVVRINPSVADLDVSQTTGNIYIQDAQLNYGLVAQTYQETTTAAVVSGITDNMPRLSYDPANPTCPSLLLEGSRLNKVKHSEFFDGWNNKSNCAFTSNYTVSPEGVQNASRLLFSSNGFTYELSSQQSSATEYTLSCYAKRNDAGTQNVGFFVNGSGAVNSAWSLTSEWQRFTYTYTSTNTAYAGIAGIAGADISVYGFQMEEGSYSTSYIPTYGSSATRTSESCSKTGISSLIGSSAGTVYAEIEKKTSGYWYLTISDSSTNNWIFIGQDVAKIRGYVRGGAVTTVDLYSSNLPNGRYKIALGYSANNVSLYVNGALIGTDTTATMPTGLSAIYLTAAGSMGGAQNIAAELKQYIIFPTRLSNADLATLTTL